MGAWGVGPFENDEALDWALDLQDAAAEGPAFVEEYLQRVAEWPADEFLEAPDCTVALAAAEVVAAMRGQRTADLPESVEAWLKGRGAPDPKLVALANAAVARTLADSELAELWNDAEPDEAKAWREHCAGLQRRLGN
jgi:hypothetical protein